MRETGTLAREQQMSGSATYRGLVSESDAKNDDPLVTLKDLIKITPFNI